MQKQIIVPLDGSTLAEHALPHASAMARATSSSLVLLQVVPLVVHSRTAAWLTSRSAMSHSGTEDFARAHAYLSSVEEGLSAQGIEVESRVREGDAAKVIVSEVSRDPNIFQIAMSTHGRSGLGRWFYGSVAEKVLQTSPVPLLLVRPAEDQQLARHAYPQTYRTIMVAMDGSTPAEQALEQARMLAVSTGAGLLLISAVPALEGMAVYLGAASLELYADAWQVENERMAGYLVEKAGALRAGGLAVDTRVVLGNPAEAIISGADQLGPDIIIMPTQSGSPGLRGLHGLQDLLLGSVALKVVQEAGLPVLLVPATDAPSPGQSLHKRAAASAEERESSGSGQGVQSAPETAAMVNGQSVKVPVLRLPGAGLEADSLERL
jgi:nucleotide-binding universal stress UspA family protein